MSKALPLEPLAAEGNSVQRLAVDSNVGAAIPWPDPDRQRCEITLSADAHVRLVTSDPSAPTDARGVTTYRDQVLTHGAITAGGDGAWNPGNWLRGLTSTAVGRIMEVVSPTQVRVSLDSGSASFNAAEVVNETTDGLITGDTGDVATTSALDDKGVSGASQPVKAVATRQEQIVYNPSPDVYTHLLVRPDDTVGTVNVELSPVGP